MKRNTLLNSIVQESGETYSPATVIELAKEYRKSSWFNDLSPKTKQAYEFVIFLLTDSHYGKSDPKSIKPKLAEAMFKSIATEHGQRTAVLFAIVWGRIYRFAATNEWLELNPWQYIKKPGFAPRDKVWTHEQFMAVIKAAESVEPPCYPIIRGLWLMYDTAQRPGDVIEMTTDMIKSDANGYYVEFRQKKTGTKVTSPLSDDAVKALDIPNYAHCSDYLIGCKLDLNTFRLDFRKYAQLAGIPKELQLRDLRRTALTQAGLGGASDDHLKALSGHKSRMMLDIYSLTGRVKALEAMKARHEGRKGVCT